MDCFEENSDETVKYRTGCHWIVILWPMIAGLLVGFLGFLLLASGWLASRNSVSRRGVMMEGTVGLAVAAVLIGRGIIRRFATEVIVSNRRVLIKTGLFSLKSAEVLLPRVESIGMNESLAGRILGYGTVVVRGIGGTSERLERIRRPNELKRQVEDQLRKTPKFV